MKLLTSLRKILIGDPYARERVLSGMTSDNLMTRIDWAENTRYRATPEYINIGITDRSPIVRLIWANRKFEFTETQMMIGISDQYESIRHQWAGKVLKSGVIPSKDAIDIGLNDVGNISKVWGDILKNAGDSALMDDIDDDGYSMDVL